MKEREKKVTKRSVLEPANIFAVIFAVYIFFLNYRIVKQCYNPFVFNDEMGYWTHAAELAGFDWHGVSGTLAWYSFGYSLMLVPLIKLIGDTVLLYRTALVMNIIMELVSYFLFIYIIRWLFPDIKKITASFVSGAAILYTAYQLNAGVTLSEAALLFVATLITFTLIRAVEKPTYLNACALGLLSAYIYMVHNRTIGIVAVAVGIVLLRTLFKKISIPKTASFFAALGIGFLLNSIIKHRLKNALWPDGIGIGNDAGSVMTKVKDAFSSVDSVQKLLSILASQGFAASAGTMCLVLFAIWCISRRIITDIIKTVRAKDKKLSDIDNRDHVFLFILGAFVSTWLISGIFMFDYIRIDHVLYTRYFDIVIGLLIMIALVMLNDADKIDLGFMALIPFVMYLGSARAAILMRTVEVQIFNKICAPGICKLYADNKQDFLAYIAISVMLFFLIVFFLTAFKKIKIGVIAASVFCIAVFNVNSGDAFEAIEYNQEYYGGERDLVKTVRNRVGSEKIYMDRSVGTFASFLQYEFKDTRLDYTDGIDDLDDGVYVFAAKGEFMKYLDYEYVGNSKNNFVFIKKINNDDDYIPLSLMSVFDADCYDPEEDSISVNHQNNFLCFGPYMTFDAGEYGIEVNYTADAVEDEDIGYVDIKSSSLGIVYDHAELKKSMIGEDGNIDVRLDLELEEKVTDIEIVTFLNDPSTLEMQLNSMAVNAKE